MIETGITGKRILVTGGCGFIGSAVVRTFVRMKAEVLNIDLMTYAATPESTAEIANSENYSLVKADIADTEAMCQAFTSFRPEIVLHLAAESHVDRSIDDSSDFLHTNVIGTVSLLNAALDYWLKLDGEEKKNFKFVHVSTDEVYGSSDNGIPFKIDSPYRPNSPYAASKASSDHFVRAWERTYGLPVIIIHSSNNYGPFQFPEKLIPTVIISALEGRKIPVYGKGINVRDWLFVQDYVDALRIVIEKGRPGGIYNIGGGTDIPNIEVVRMLCRLLDEKLPRSPNKPHEKLITFVTDRPGHDLRYALDSSEMRKLGWRPLVSFEKGLSDTVDWYIENRAWWERLIREGLCGSRMGLGNLK